MCNIKAYHLVQKAVQYMEPNLLAYQANYANLSSKIHTGDSTSLSTV